MTATTIHGDCRDVLPTLPAQSVQCVVTSPPYYGLRDYGVAGQIGMEPIPDCLAWARRRIVSVEPFIDEDGETYYLPTYGKPEPPCGSCYVCSLRVVFRALWRVLRDDGVAWLNLGDSYSGGKQGRDDEGPADIARRAAAYGTGAPKALSKGANGVARKPPEGMKPKSLLLIPSRVALALQADGWIVRSDIVWAKNNPMPESVKDRPTRAHESIYLLAKQERYYYDADAVREPYTESSLKRYESPFKSYGADSPYGAKHGALRDGGEISPNPDGRNLRDVWTINPQPYSGAHFAVFPLAIPDRCIRASTRPGDTVLDPFGGSGTTARAAIALQRHCILIELNESYLDLQADRTDGVQLELLQ